MLASQVEPSYEIGRHCSEPFECDYKHHCWAHLPENSVFDIYLAGEKAWELYREGIYSITDSPENLLTAQGNRYN